MFYNLLYLVPKNWVSRMVGHVVDKRWPFGLHTVIRDGMIRAFKVNTAEAEYPLAHYQTWGTFFTRRLRAGERPLGASALICPVDGTMTQRGRIDGGESPELLLTQIKGIRYSLGNLLAGWDPAPYAGGAFITVYLAPYNYHRIHAPAAGRVLRARHVPGALWPVNAWSVGNIAGLFVRNDRVLVEMECDLPATTPANGDAPAAAPVETGRMTIALVGATNVGRTTLSFADLRGNDPSARGGSAGMYDFTPTSPVPLAKGAELACFEMGSTIVLVLDAAWAARLRPGLLTDSEAVTVRLGLDFLKPAP